MEMVGEPAHGTSTEVTGSPILAVAEVPAVQNLERPDMCWTSDFLWLLRRLSPRLL